MGAAVLTRSKSQIHWPWFILFFCLAAVLNTYLPSLASVSGILSNLGKLGLTATLFLIGTGLSHSHIEARRCAPSAARSNSYGSWLRIWSLYLIVAGVISL